MLGGTVTGSPVKAKSDERTVINVVTTRRAGFMERNGLYHPGITSPDYSGTVFGCAIKQHRNTATA
jgi:hypothetical protein